MAFKHINTIDVAFDNKVYGNLIDPAEWNKNFIDIEQNITNNAGNLNDNFAMLSGTDGAANITTPDLMGETEDASTVSAQLASIVQRLLDTYTITELDNKFEQVNASTINSIIYNADNGSFTITNNDGNSTVIDTNIEKIPVSVSLEKDGESVMLVITNYDGTTSSADVTNLLNVYTFIDSNSLRFDADKYNISAEVKKGSITLEHLADGVVSTIEKIRDESRAAKNDAEVAKTAAESAEANSEQSAKIAESYAVGTSGIRTGEATDNAKYYSGESKSAQNAAETAKLEAIAARNEAMEIKEAVETLPKSYYGICNTAASEKDKIITVDDSFKLEVGVIVNVKFNDDNTHPFPDLNVNGTGSKAMAKGTLISVGKNYWTVGSVVQFIYDGSYWVVNNALVGLSESVDSNSITDAATPSAVKKAYNKAAAAETLAQTAKDTADAAATPEYVDSAVAQFAESALQIVGANFLPNTGGVINGSLVLNNDPVGTYEATHKKYVDDADAAVKVYIDEKVADIPTNISANKVYYGVCNTSPTTTEKTVTTDSDFILEAGVSIDIKFLNTLLTFNPTLNVNNTGAKAIKLYSDTPPTTYQWIARSVIRFVYDGTYWIMVNGAPASTTYYGITKLSNSTSNASQTEAATPYAVKTVMDKANASYEQAARNKVWQGTCETINEAIKEVNVGEGFELYNGVKIRVYFESNTVSTGTLSLNVNGTGAFEIVTVEGMTLHPRFIQGGDYLNFTYTETSWGSATEPYNVWMIDNVTIAGINNFGVVRVKNSPNANQDGKDGFAVSPKALQAVKDIADAAFPKSGGTMSGNLHVDVTGSSSSTSFVAVDYGECVAEMTADNSKSSLGLFGDGAGSVEVNATTNTSNATFNGTGSTLSLYGASSTEGNGASGLYIKNINGNRRIYGLSPLTSIANGSYATPKSYVDLMTEKIYYQYDGTEYLGYGGSNNLLITTNSVPWEIECTNTVYVVKITACFSTKSTSSSSMKILRQDDDVSTELFEVSGCSQSATQMMSFSHSMYIDLSTTSTSTIIKGELTGDVQNPILIVEVIEKQTI